MLNAERASVFQRIRRWEIGNLYQTSGERIFFSALAANSGLVFGTLASGVIVWNREVLGIQVFTSYAAINFVLGLHIAFDVACAVGAIRLRNEANRGMENFFFRYPKKIA